MIEDKAKERALPVGNVSDDNDILDHKDKLFCPKYKVFAYSKKQLIESQRFTLKIIVENCASGLFTLHSSLFTFFTFLTLLRSVKKSLFPITTFLHHRQRHRIVMLYFPEFTGDIKQRISN